MPNLYIAATRRSALDPELDANLARYAVPLADAVAHATRDAAYSCRWEALTGRLEAGKAADFAVLDADPFGAGAESLLDAGVRLTVVAGTATKP